MQGKASSWVWEQSHGQRPCTEVGQAPGQCQAGLAQALTTSLAKPSSKFLPVPSIPLSPYLRSPTPPAPAFPHAWFQDSQHGWRESAASYTLRHSSDRNRDRKLCPLNSACVCKPLCRWAVSWSGSAGDTARVGRGRGQAQACPGQAGVGRTSTVAATRTTQTPTPCPADSSSVSDTCPPKPAALSPSQTHPRHGSETRREPQSSKGSFQATASGGGK